MRLRRSPADDAALLEQDFEGFYVRWERPLLAYFARRCPRPELAADLTAETFARALAGRGRFDPTGGPVSAWLFGIARHLLVDSVRAGQVEDPVRRQLEMAPLALDDEALARIDELAGEAALAALDELPESQRAAVRAHVIDERAYGELAGELRCSESVVRQRVSRGLRALRGRLEEQR